MAIYYSLQDVHNVIRIDMSLIGRKVSNKKIFARNEEVGRFHMILETNDSTTPFKKNDNTVMHKKMTKK